MRQNLKDVVAARFRDEIFGGDLVPGQRIDQDSLAERWGVSRLPIREALISLESEGLIQMIPRRGAFVAPLSKSEIINHYHLYGLISAFATELATFRLTEGELDQLKRCNDELSVEEDPVQQESINFRFHQLIGTSCGSDRVRAVLRTLGRSMPGNHFDLIEGWRETSHQDHVEIYHALKRRDAKAASEAMLAHLDRGAHVAAGAIETIWQHKRKAD